MDHALITGGYDLDVQRKVSKYTRDGWIEDLPELNSGRYDHGCGHFKNDENIMVRQNLFLFFENKLILGLSRNWRFQPSVPAVVDLN